MTGKRKGIADIMILMGMIIGIVLIFFDFTPFWTEGDTYRVVLHTHMYGMSNALDGAELYASASLDYSVYQALYDTLKRGGFEAVSEDTGEDGMAYWGDPDSIPTREKVDEALIKGMEQNLAKYTSAGYSFTQDYDITLPRYNVSLQDESGKLRVTTAAEDANMVVTKLIQEYGMKEDITIKRFLLPEGVYDINYIGMLDTGRERSPSIKETFQAAFSNANTYIKDYAPITSCSDIKSCSDDLTEEFKKKLIRELETPYERGNYLITPEILDVSVTVELIDNGKITKYKATATQKVTINETELFAKYYPVWNGSEITFDNLKLIFINKASETTILPPEGF